MLFECWLCIKHDFPAACQCITYDVQLFEGFKRMMHNNYEQIRKIAVVSRASYTLAYIHIRWFAIDISISVSFCRMFGSTYKIYLMNRERLFSLLQNEMLENIYVIKVWNCNFTIYTGIIIENGLQIEHVRTCITFLHISKYINS